MKNLIFSLILINLLSCSHQSGVKPDIILNKNMTIDKTEIKNENSTTELPSVKEITNFDFEFQNSLKEVWGSYFKENYNESRSIDIFIATNRLAKSSNFGCTNQNFGISLDPNPNLKMGICRINVPKNHSTGEIEFTTDSRASSNKFFKIVNSRSINEQAMIDFVKKTKRTPLIFVHGFNVKYQDAILRASQITYDLKYQGPVILFTWPSGSGDGFLDERMLTKTYEQNQKSAKESINIFKNFLGKFTENNIPVNLVVHSMGHQVVLPALTEIVKENPAVVDNKVVNELILNAPDFETNEFQNILDFLKNSSKRVTLYCSFNDKAMMASNSINKNERLGACANVDGIDTINVSLIDDKTFGTGHSYYSSRAIITDVFQVLLGLDVEKRLFMKKSEPNSTEKFYLRN